MELGGNRRMREYFEKYNLNKWPIQNKYKTKAAEVYRKNVV